MHVPRRRGIGHGAESSERDAQPARTSGVRNVRRYSAGATPTAVPKWWRSSAAEPNPAREATVSTARSVLSSSVLRVVQPLCQQPLAGRGAGLGGEAAGEGALGHRRPLGEQRARAGPRRGARASRSAAGSGCRRCSRGPAGRCTGAGRRRAAAAPPSGGRSGWRPTAPSSQRTWCRQASMPAAVPALVIIRSSSTKSTSGSTLASGNRRFSSSVCRQCVVQARPSSSPASPSRNAPEHTESTQAPRACARRKTSSTCLGRRLGVVVGRRDHEVGVLGCGQPVRGGEREPVVHRDRLAGLLRAGPEVDRGDAVVGPVDAEDLDDHAELEHRRSLRQDPLPRGKVPCASMADRSTGSQIAATGGRTFRA